MKRLFVLLLLLLPAPAWAQCNGAFGTGQVCGNSTPGVAPPTATSLANMVASFSIKVPVRSSSAATITVSAVTDYFLCLDPTSNAITVNLPATPATGLTFLIKDCTGQANAHNITVTPASGNIDGAASSVMSTNFQSEAVTYTGAQWSIN